jgi:hypothetical protein
MPSVKNRPLVFNAECLYTECHCAKFRGAVSLVKVRARSCYRRGRLCTVYLVRQLVFIYRKRKGNQCKKELVRTSLYKEVNCTDPSPSSRIPSLGLTSFEG